VGPTNDKVTVGKPDQRGACKIEKGGKKARRTNKSQSLSIDNTLATKRTRTLSGGFDGKRPNFYEIPISLP
jgi:hypothetical protein